MLQPARLKANKGDEDGREGSDQIACAAGQTEESDAMKEIFSYACVLTKTECIELLESKEIVRLRADRPKIGAARRRLASLFFNWIKKSQMREL